MFHSNEHQLLVCYLWCSSSQQGHHTLNNCKICMVFTSLVTSWSWSCITMHTINMWKKRMG
jgi:hypothetical protein